MKNIAYFTYQCKKSADQVESDISIKADKPGDRPVQHKLIRKGGEQMELIGAAEVKQLLGVGNNRAYEIIRQLNAELEQKGYLTIRGKIPKAYLLERFYH